MYVSYNSWVYLWSHVTITLYPYHEQLWDVRNKKLLIDLPGHADEVFSVDWSPSGEQVASGGRDRHIKMYVIM